MADISRSERQLAAGDSRLSNDDLVPMAAPGMAGNDKAIAMTWGELVKRMEAALAIPTVEQIATATKDAIKADPPPDPFAGQQFRMLSFVEHSQATNAWRSVANISGKIRIHQILVRKGASGSWEYRLTIDGIASVISATSRSILESPRGFSGSRLSGDTLNRGGPMDCNSSFLLEYRRTTGSRISMEIGVTYQVRP